MISGSAPAAPAAASSRDQYWKARPQPGSITGGSFALPGRGVGVAPLGGVADEDTKIEGAATDPRTVTAVGATCGEAGGAEGVGDALGVADDDESQVVWVNH